jgi:hypothetical protein
LFSGGFYNYDSYCSMYEDVFRWILEASDELHAMDDIADDLETIKCQVKQGTHTEGKGLVQLTSSLR